MDPSSYVLGDMVATPKAVWIDGLQAGPTADVVFAYRGSVIAYSNCCCECGHQYET